MMSLNMTLVFLFHQPFDYKTKKSIEYTFNIRGEGGNFEQFLNFFQ